MFPVNLQLPEIKNLKGQYISKSQMKISNTALCTKIISQKWMEFAFGNTYPHQTFTECGFIQCTHFDITDVTTSYGRHFDFIAFFVYFHT